MTFVDTNYFLRFLLHDNEDQFNQAKQLFLDASRTQVSLFTSSIVFFEVAWILRKAYGKDKEALIKTLFKMTSLSVDFEDRDLIINSLSIYRDTNLSLEDCYNFLFAKMNNAKDFKTFDEKLKKKFRSL